MNLPTIHVIDFEGDKHCGIEEWGVATIKNGKIDSIQCNKCQSLTYLHEEIDNRLCQNSENNAINNIGNVQAYDFYHYIPQFIKLRLSGIFAAHGKGFDNSLIRMYKKSPGMVPDFSKYNPESHFNNTTFEIDVKKLPKVSKWGPWLDTHKIIKKYYQDFDDYSVEAVVKKLKLNALVRKNAKNFQLEKDMQVFHCAAYDALAEATILCLILDMFNITSIEELL